MSPHKDRNKKMGVCHLGVVTLWMASFMGLLAEHVPRLCNLHKSSPLGETMKMERKDWGA